jgi:hypothetical protein
MADGKRATHTVFASHLLDALNIYAFPSACPIAMIMSPRFRCLKMALNYHKIDGFPGSSTVEHSAVNRRVASSNLARGAKPL